MSTENQLIQTRRSIEAWVRNVEIPIAVYSLAILGTAVGVVARVYPARSDGTVLTINDIPVIARPVVYALFALLIWAGIRICMRLIPHIFRHFRSWWAKLLWFCFVILAVPVGPAVYYLVVFRKDGSEQAA